MFYLKYLNNVDDEINVILNRGARLHIYVKKLPDYSQ